MTIRNWAMRMVVGFLVSACGAGGQDGETGGGRVSVSLVQAPADARCAVFTITPAGASAITRQAALGPGQAATFVLSGLPVGNVTLTEQVFTVSCATIAGRTATWVSNSVSLNLQPGLPADANFTLHRADSTGIVTIHSDFPATPNTFSEFDTGTALQPVGDITSGPDGALWFGSVQNVGRITTAGIITSLNAPGFPGSILTGLDGNLWLSFEDTNEIGRMTTKGLLTRFTLPNFGAAIGLTVGADGNVWFANIFDNAIGFISTGGALTQVHLGTAVNSPSGITVGPDNNLWFAERNTSRIGRMTPSGVIAEFATPTAASLPTHVVAGPDGNIWFTETLGNRIGRMSTSGSNRVEFAVPTVDSQPWTIISAPDGNLWFVELLGNKLARITTSGTITEFPIPTPNARPNGLATGPDGNLWLTELGQARIARFKP